MSTETTNTTPEAPALLGLGSIDVHVNEPFDGTAFICLTDRDSFGVASLSASECRELAAWLMNAADFLETGP